MRKVFLTVVASLLLGALLVQPQAPNGAAPAGKGGPDAVPANLVNTVCASCHTLDRVNNKKGDKDAWTSTVNNMVAKGAALTADETPILVDYLVRTAGNFTVTLTAPDGAAKGGGGKKGGKGGKGGGGGFVPKNVKVLTSATLPAAMQGFVEGLGLLDKGACSFCHVQDRSSDEKMEKVIARNMITMVREINARFPDGKQHVTCYTCHRGSPMPLTVAP